MRLRDRGGVLVSRFDREEAAEAATRDDMRRGFTAPGLNLVKFWAEVDRVKHVLASVPCGPDECDLDYLCTDHRAALGYER